MKKRLCSILLGLCLVLTMLPTMALAAGGEDGTQANPWNISAEGEGNNVTAYLERNDDGPTYTLVISGSGAMKDFKFSSPSGYWTSDAPWHTALTVDSSTNRYPITALEIGDGITHIGSAAFASLSIPEISFKRNVTSYGTYVYISCTAVTTVDWTNFSFETIPEGLLYGCSALTTFKNGSTISDDYALMLPDTVTGIGTSSFFGCTSLIRADLTNLSKSVGQNAFMSCTGLKQVDLPKTVDGSCVDSYFGTGCFSTSAIETITLPENVTTISNNMFNRCGLLTDVKTTSSIKTIGETAFFCDKDSVGKTEAPWSSFVGTNLDLSGVTTIGESAFNSCSSLKSVIRLDSIQNLGERAFGDCTSVQVVDMSKAGESITYANNAFTQLGKGSVIYITNNSSSLTGQYEGIYSKDKTVLAITNGGTFPAMSQFVAGQLAEPVKGGYKFEGWYESATFEDEALTGTPIAGKTYYAKWEEKAEQSAPAAPTLKDRGYTSITLETIEGAQYRCNGGAWQTFPEFTGLTAGTVYTFETRYPETENYKASPVSDAVEFSTLYYVAPSVSSNSVSAPSTPNGTVTVSPANASKGTTVTVATKPNEGYELGSLTVTDANGNALALTDLGDGKYSFVMPGSKVSVEASFVKTAVSTGFADVPADAYFADAVKWAVDKGVTNGLTDSLFGPYEPCTRAQIVTFLWRAAGSPEPTSTSTFADVPASAYYAKAVAWAVENGITDGMTATEFAPDATCTRGQSVTFLYRALKGTAGSGASFGDVASGAFYADAVNWAVASNVTNGTSDTTFSPDASCTRAEIVTFLYRAYQGK